MLGMDPISLEVGSLFSRESSGTFQARKCLNLLEDPGHSTCFSFL